MKCSFIIAYEILWYFSQSNQRQISFVYAKLTNFCFFFFQTTWLFSTLKGYKTTVFVNFLFVAQTIKTVCSLTVRVNFHFPYSPFHLSHLSSFATRRQGSIPKRCLRHVVSTTALGNPQGAPALLLPLRLAFLHCWSTSWPGCRIQQSQRTHRPLLRSHPTLDAKSLWRVQPLLRVWPSARPQVPLAEGCPRSSCGQSLQAEWCVYHPAAAHTSGHLSAMQYWGRSASCQKPLGVNLVFRHVNTWNSHVRSKNIKVGMLSSRETGDMMTCSSSSRSDKSFTLNSLENKIINQFEKELFLCCHFFLMNFCFVLHSTLLSYLFELWNKVTFYDDIIQAYLAVMGVCSAYERKCCVLDLTYASKQYE